MTNKTLFTVGFALFAFQTWLGAAFSVSQFGITWTFDEERPVGQYANGDWWVLGPVTITEITPKSVNKSGWIKNGTQLNPPVSGSQGFDNSMDYMSYDASKNVSPSITGKPLRVTTGSLVSTISKSTKDNRPQLQVAAILTVVAEQPAPGSFRPAPVDPNKSSKWTINDLDYSVLANLPKTPETPNIRNLEGRFEKPWLELNTSWTGRYIHPASNQPDYGRDMASLIGQAMMALQFDYSNKEKETLLVRLVQYGIDVWGTAKAGGVWQDLGGHNQGRKLPLLLAGAALNAPEILEYGDAKKHFIFQEDRQTWYVTEADVGRKLYTADGRQRDRYIASDVGVAEWGEQHTKNKARDGRNWNAYYRNIVGSSLMAHATAARLMGLDEAWNWPAFFDYMDRFYQMEKDNATGGTNRMGVIEALVYARYILTNYLPSAPHDLRLVESD